MFYISCRPALGTRYVRQRSWESAGRRCTEYWVAHQHLRPGSESKIVPLTRDTLTDVALEVYVKKILTVAPTVLTLCFGSACCGGASALAQQPTQAAQAPAPA